MRSRVSRSNFIASKTKSVAEHLRIDIDDDAVRWAEEIIRAIDERFPVAK